MVEKQAEHGGVKSPADVRLSRRRFIQSAARWISFALLGGVVARAAWRSPPPRVSEQPGACGGVCSQCPAADACPRRAANAAERPANEETQHAPEAE